MRELWHRLRFLLHRGQFERDLDEEMRHHLALKAAEEGSPDAARRQFGNVVLLKEDSRAMWTWNFAEQFVQDIRYALRTMAVNRLFAAMAVLSLALGIGANTAIYSFMDAVMLRALPVSHPEELVVFKWTAKGRTTVVHSLHGSNSEDDSGNSTSPNYPFAAFVSLGARNDKLTTLFAYANAWGLNLTAGGQAEVAGGLYVSGGFFTGLGVPPAAGRLISAEDDRTGAAPVVVIAYPYWQTRFAGKADAIGKTMLVNNMPVTIVGVTAPGFFGVDPGSNPPVFIPLHAAPSLSRHPAEEERSDFFDKNFYWVEMMGRLRPGVSIEQAQAQMAARFHSFATGTAANKQETANLPALRLEEGGSGIDSLRREYSKPLFVLMAIANLLLARATARRHEIALRLSLGAGRWRIVRQLLTESLLLSVLGGLLGLLVAYWSIQSITWLIANGRDDFTLRAVLNLPVLGFTLALALLTGLVFGLVPAIQATKVDLTPALKETRASAPHGKLSRFGICVGASQFLVVGQVAVSLLLVVGAGLFVRTVSNLHSVQLGFNQENILIFSVNARQAGYKDAALASLYGNLLDRFRKIPGVRSGGLSDLPLVSYYWNGTGLRIPGTSLGAKELNTCLLTVDPSFLSTMQIPIILGRGIEERDLASPRVAVVNQVFADKFFANQSPVGRAIGIGDPKDAADIVIVGVVRAAHYNSVQEKETPPVAYVPYTQSVAGLNQVFFELRTSGDPLALAGSVRRIVGRTSPGVPITDVNTQSHQIDQTIGQQRTFASLCTCFAVLALLIACVGLYGTMAYAVARRTGEIGIRMALGAARRNIIWMVMREVVALAVVGVAIGLAVALETTRFLESFLFGTKPNDPLAISISLVILTCACMAAGYVPAWRASQTSPMSALRNE